MLQVVAADARKLLAALALVAGHGARAARVLGIRLPRADALDDSVIEADADVDDVAAGGHKILLPFYLP